MRKNRVIEQNRCYHLVSRLAHRTFFLDDEEKDRAVALMRRVEEFSGVVVLAYAFMSNHFHIFIYVPSAEEIGEGEILRRIRVLYRDASLSQVVATWNRLKTEEQELFKRARPTKKYVSRFEAYKSSFLRRMWNSAEFMRTFKQHFTMSFNGRREHSGTMFEGRYHERNNPAEYVNRLPICSLPDQDGQSPLHTHRVGVDEEARAGDLRVVVGLNPGCRRVAATDAYLVDAVVQRAVAAGACRETHAVGGEVDGVLACP